MNHVVKCVQPQIFKRCYFFRPNKMNKKIYNLDKNYWLLNYSGYCVCLSQWNFIQSNILVLIHDYLPIWISAKAFCIPLSNLSIPTQNKFHLKIISNIFAHAFCVHFKSHRVHLNDTHTIFYIIFFIVD